MDPVIERLADSMLRQDDEDVQLASPHQGVSKLEVPAVKPRRSVVKPSNRNRPDIISSIYNNNPADLHRHRNANNNTSQSSLASSKKGLVKGKKEGNRTVFAKRLNKVRLFIVQNPF